MTRTATGRLVWAILIALVVGWLTPGSAFAVSRSATSQVADDALHHAQTTYTALPESGPATAYDQFTTYDDVDRSHGPSPRSEAPTSATAYSYDHPALLVQFADVAGMTQEQVRRTNGDLSALGSAGVAAMTGPKVANPCRANSFTGTTLVLMADGTRKPIKDVKLGDKVIATDPETGERGPRKVIDLIRHGGLHTMVALRLSDGTSIDATDRHPFWVESQGAWVDAIDLRPGDVLVAADGKRLSVASAGIREQDLTAYNLTVTGLHTYHVSASEVLVHNCRVSPHAQRQMDVRGVSQAEVDQVLERQPFSYWHEDQWKSGFYDPKSRLFVAKTIDDTVNTVMTNVDKAYVSQLQRRRP